MSKRNNPFGLGRTIDGESPELDQLTLTANNGKRVKLDASNTTTSDYSFVLPVSGGTSTNVLSTDGTGVTSWATAGTVPSILLQNDGSQTVPSFSFTNDPDVGLFRPSTNTLGITTGGTQRLSISTTGITSTLPIDHPLGTVLLPSITLGDSDTGIYSTGLNTINLAANGVNRMTVGASVTTITSPDTTTVFQVANGANTFNSGGTLTIQNSTEAVLPTTAALLCNGGAMVSKKLMIGGSLTMSGSTSGTTVLLSNAVAGTSVLTLPVATDTLVGKATTDIFSNKSSLTTVLNGATSGVLTLQPGAVTTNHTLIFPSAQGSASTVLTNNGSGTLTWSAAAGGSTAWTALQILNAKKSTFRGIYDSDNIGFLNTKMCSNGAGVALCISSASGNSLLTFDGCYLGAINPNTITTLGLITGGTVGYHDIAYSSGNSIFVAISKTTASRYSVGSVSATDAYGVSFAATVSFSTNKLWERIVYSPELNIFVVCNLSSAASTQNFMYSTTGASPTFTLCNAHTSGLFVGIQWCSNNAGGGFFYATGAASGASMTSTDGATWVNCTAATNTGASTCVAWDKVNQRGVIGYVSGTPVYKFTITNASTVVYTAATTIPTGGLTISDGCFCIGPSLFLLGTATGSGYSCAISSSDGLVWVSHYGFGWVNDVSRISYCEEYNSALIGSGTASKYAVSSMIKPC